MNSFARGVRNAFRNGIRTVSVVLILALAIGLALAMLVARAAIGKQSAQTTAQMNRLSANVGTSITISPAGAQGGGPGGIYGAMKGGDAGNSSDNSSTLTLTSDNLASIAKIPHITAASGILMARAASGDTNLTAPAISVPPGARIQMRDGSGNVSGANGGQSFTPPVAFDGVSDLSAAANALGGSITFTGGSASDFDAGGNANIAIVGDQIAKQNNLTVGSTFTAYGQTIKVVGIISSSSSSSSNSSSGSDVPANVGRSMGLGSAVILPLASLQSLSGQSGSIDQIIATVDTASNVATATTAIQNLFGTDSNGNNLADVQNQLDQANVAKTSAQATIDSLNSIETTATVSVIACGVAAAVIIFLAMLMIVRERRGEIGVLKAIGAKGKTIVTQFVAESLVLTVLAAIIGLGVGILAATPLTNTLVSSAENSSQSSSSDSANMPPTNTGERTTFTGNMRNFANNTTRSLGIVTTQIDWTIVLWALGSAIIIAAIGATAASLVAIRVRPAEAVRAE